MDREGVPELEERIAPFRAAMSRPGTRLDEMALALSRVLQPGLDVLEAMVALDELAGACPTPTRDGVVEHLFGPDGAHFVGDSGDYHRWQNSCLDHVVASRRGMPITLAVVAIEVARRVGVRLVGVGMPGHFLVGDADESGWYADPYGGRTAMSADDCRGLYASMGGRRWSDRFLAPTPDRLIIARMLNNLKLSVQQRHDPVRLALVMSARQVLVEFAGERDEAALARAILN